MSFNKKCNFNLYLFIKLHLFVNCISLIVINHSLLDKPQGTQRHAKAAARPLDLDSDYYGTVLQS